MRWRAAAARMRRAGVVDRRRRRPSRSRRPGAGSSTTRTSSIRSSSRHDAQRAAGRLREALQGARRRAAAAHHRGRRARRPLSRAQNRVRIAGTFTLVNKTGAADPRRLRRLSAPRDGARDGVRRARDLADERARRCTGTTTCSTKRSRPAATTDVPLRPRLRRARLRATTAPTRSCSPTAASSTPA